MKWFRRMAGCYIVSVCNGVELDRDGNAFLIRHYNVNAIEDGRWEAFWRRGDEQNKPYRIGFYRTMRDAKRAAELHMVDAMLDAVQRE